jgi:hypothetical protein
MNRGGGTLKQPWLSFVRLVWVILAGYNALPGLLAIPQFYHELLALTPPPNTAGWNSLNFSSAVALSGLAPQLVAWILLLPTLIKTLVFLCVGLLIFLRRSNEWLGLLASYVLVGLCGTFYGDRFQFLAGLMPFWHGVARLVGESLWLALFMFLVIFPDGRYRPTWTRWVGISLSVWFAATEIPTLISGSTPDWISWIGLPIILLILIGQVQRYRKHAAPAARQQIRGFIAAIGFFTLYGSLELLARHLFPLPEAPQAENLYIFLAANLVSDLVFVFIPLAIAIAIFRYHLWDIDLVIRRTLAYGILTFFIGLVYFGSVTLLQTVFTVLAGQQSPLAVVLSTLVIAVLVNPLRRRIHAIIDRRFFRSQYDADRALEHFSQNLRERVELHTIEKELAVVVGQALQPEHMSLWMRKGEKS